jgi:hypothetical protein
MIGFLAPDDEPSPRHLLPCPFIQIPQLLDAASDVEDDPDEYVDDYFPPVIECRNFQTK